MKKTILLIICIFFTLIVFELFLKFSPFSNGISPVVYDKDIGMWHKKDFDNYLIKECYKNKYFFDKEGRVKNNYTYKKDKKDIILLGDSQIEALMVENSSIMHNSLYKELDGQFNVLNYALSGTSTTQQYQILKTKVNLLNTDTIIQFIFLENDLNDLDFKNNASVNRPKVHLNFKSLDSFNIIKPKAYNIKEKIRDFLGQFELYAYLKKSIYYYQNLISFKHSVKKENLNEEKDFILKNEEFKWKQLIGAIYQTNKLLNSLNINYFIIVYSDFEFSNNHLGKVKRLTTFLNENEIMNLNIVPYLKQLDKTKELSFSCDSHWNGTTHKNLAKYLKAKLF